MQRTPVPGGGGATVQREPGSLNHHVEEEDLQVGTTHVELLREKKQTALVLIH